MGTVSNIESMDFYTNTHIKVPQMFLIFFYKDANPDTNPDKAKILFNTVKHAKHASI